MNNNGKLDPELKSQLDRIRVLTQGAYERADWAIFLGLVRLYEKLVKEA